MSNEWFSVGKVDDFAKDLGGKLSGDPSNRFGNMGNRMSRNMKENPEKFNKSTKGKIKAGSNPSSNNPTGGGK